MMPLNAPKREYNASWLKALTIVLFILLIPACSTIPATSSLKNKAIPEPDSVSANSPNQKGYGWRYMGFYISWPKEQEAVSWHIDTLIAHKVIKPVLKNDVAELKLWRFHRRAVRDKTGHRFSFLFYTNKQQADKLASRVLDSPFLASLEQADVIKRVDFSDSNNNVQPNIEDTSDKNWSIEVQRSWPYYIMGVSEMWLALIDEVVEKQKHSEPQQFEDIQGWLNYYSGIESNVSGIWCTEGNHAFLHHLNALFAYKETIILERKLKRF